tara:strand:+ start:2573 stop:2863 length:291 start_codon:yes stop_codon:yes gene_type:complete
MILKKVFIGIFLLGLLSGCGQNISLLGPIYTLSTTGNVYQAGLSYGSDRAVTSLTGKSTAQNIREILIPKKNESEFHTLVKNRISETRKKLGLVNQ